MQKGFEMLQDIYKKVQKIAFFSCFFVFFRLKYAYKVKSMVKAEVEMKNKEMAKKRLAAYAVKVRKCHNEKAKEEK